MSENDETPNDKLDDETMVNVWRIDTLMAAGYRAEDAISLALTHEIDLHWAVELAARCGPDQAARILI